MFLRTMAEANVVDYYKWVRTAKLFEGFQGSGDVCDYMVCEIL